MNVFGSACSTKDLNVNYINTRALQVRNALENKGRYTRHKAWAKMILTIRIIFAYKP